MKQIRPRIYTLIGCIVASSLLSGCASNIGNRQINDIGRYMSLEKGKSDKRTVYATFGQPHDVIYRPSGDSSWEYYYSKATVSGASFIPFVGLVAGGLNTDTTISRMLFDSSGIFEKVETQSYVNYINQWAGIAESTNELLTDTKHLRVEPEMQKLGFIFDPAVAKSVKDIGVVTKRKPN